MTLHIKIFIKRSIRIVLSLPLKSTKFNLDVSNFWEFESESWEWEFVQQNWESRLRMRWEFSLRVSISREITRFQNFVGTNDFPTQLFKQIQHNCVKCNIDHTGSKPLCVLGAHFLMVNLWRVTNHGIYIFSRLNTYVLQY